MRAVSFVKEIPRKKLFIENVVRPKIKWKCRDLNKRVFPPQTKFFEQTSA